MKRLLPLLLLCACAGSLVDHDGVSAADSGGGAPPTQACLDTCVAAPEGATPRCDGNTCTYTCNAGLLKTPLTNSCSVPSAIAAGGNHTCAIASGQVLCWGSNSVGELGVGLDTIPSTGTPVQVPGLPAAASQIAASRTQTCVVLVGGAAWCWGAGQPPHQIDGITGSVNAIAAGDRHACAATATDVWCWGDNSLGQLGRAPDPGQTAPVPVPGVPGASVLVAGQFHTCAGSGSQMYCWGANDAGQDGTGAKSATSLPAVVLGAGAAFAGAGENHTCSATTNPGSLACWGANGSAQIDGSKLDQTRPKGTLSAASAMAGGTGHTCAISAGVLSCWGLNQNGQLGSGDFNDRTNPVKPLSGVASVAAGSHHTCALLLDNSLKCWGANDLGQLGSGTISGNTPTPVDVSGR